MGSKASLGMSLLLVLPLFFVYEVGLLVSPFGYNGVDLITPHLASLAQGSPWLFLILNLALLAGLAYVIRRRDSKLTMRLATVTLAESAVWAAAMFGLMLATLWAFGYHPLGEDRHTAYHVDLATAVVASAGAGFHEELVFRLIIMGSAVWLLRVLKVTETRSVWLAITGTALVFAGAHHWGPGHEPFRLVAFTDRAIGGVLLGAVAYYRSFAQAVYAHFLYDVAAFLM
jgi:hypothetical protein